MPASILVAITCFNCQAQIERVLDQLMTPLAKKWVCRAIVIDNQSTDKTYQSAIEWKSKSDCPLVVFRNKKNYGLGGSHKSAFKYIQDHAFSHVVILHGDDQANLEELLELLEKQGLKEDTSYLGARFHRDSNLIGYSKLRTFGNQIFNKLFSFASGKKILDLGSGLNMYPRTDLERSWYIKFPDNLTFNYVFFLGLFQRKAKFLYFPLTWVEEDQTSNVRMLRQTKALISILLSYTFSRKSFFKKDHRDEIIDDYVFSNVVHNK